MVCISKKIQDDIKEVVDALSLLKEESKEIYKGYWATDAHTLVAALPGDTDAATLSTKLTKGNYVDAITLAEDLEDFFGNESVTQTDYPANCLKIKYSDAATPEKLSEATEMIGERCVQMANDCLTLLQNCNNVLEFYSANKFSSVLGVLSNEDIIWGSSMTKSNLALAAVLLQQFQKMMTNQAVTTGDYAETLALWKKY